MIRSGKLDRLITLERKTETVSAPGAVSKTWAGITTVRAELVQQSADEYLRGYGEAEHGTLVFRIRYLPGITTADRVSYQGAAYDLDQIAELGRKRGLELRVSGGAA
ncbi:MAG: phage head closure protein [Rhodobacterales bacterium]|nr:phage head closure protein [Rhodobacterales bacterium]